MQWRRMPGLIWSKQFLMGHDKTTNTEDDESAARISPEASFISRIVFVTGGVLVSVLFILTVLDICEIMEYPRFLFAYSNPLIMLGCCATYFCLMYVNWSNYFWRRDTEQKHRLFWPVLTTLGFFVLFVYVIWRY